MLLPVDKEVESSLALANFRHGHRVPLEPSFELLATSRVAGEPEARRCPRVGARARPVSDEWRTSARVAEELFPTNPVRVAAAKMG